MAETANLELPELTEEQATRLLERHAKILEMIATGQPAAEVYEAIALMYEGRHPGMRCSLLELKGDKLMHGGAPSLPQEYCDAINGLQNGPDVGSCGTSTYTGKRVLVENIETDPKWAEIKHHALPHGMRCCWSEPIKDSKGKVLGAFGMYYDFPCLPNEQQLEDLVSAARLTGIVMEREQRETALRQTEFNYNRLIENLPHRFFLKNKDLVFISCSSNLAKDLGKSVEEVVGKTDAELFPAEFAEKFMEDDRRVMNGGIPDEREVTITRDGEEQTTLVVKAPALDENGEVDGILGFYTDITEQKQLEENYNRAQKMESLGILAGGVAHDLNNILSVVVAYSEILLADLPEGNPMTAHIQKMKNSGFKASAIVADLLTIARGIAVTKVPIMINDLINDYLNSSELEELKSVYPEISVVQNLSPDLMNIHASSVHFSKVIMNLVSNAFESIKTKGTVTIATFNRHLDSEIQGFETIEAGDYVVLSIHDNGPGVTNTDIKRIFEPFYTRKAMDRSGTGLGLTVVWNIVRDFKGGIDVISNNEGIAFELYFPITREAVKENESAPLAHYKGNGEKILIVDDMELQRETASALLDRLDYRTVTVSSGEEAIEYLREHTADLVLLDMVMAPGMNGRETFEKIVEHNPGQKAVIVSGYAETSEVKRAQSLGAGQYVKKPYSLETIGVAIQQELNQE